MESKIGDLIYLQLSTQVREVLLNVRENEWGVMGTQKKCTPMSIWWTFSKLSKVSKGNISDIWGESVLTLEIQ